jgi:hypothetical protein
VIGDSADDPFRNTRRSPLRPDRGARCSRRSSYPANKNVVSQQEAVDNMSVTNLLYKSIVDC